MNTRQANRLPAEPCAQTQMFLRPQDDIFDIQLFLVVMQDFVILASYKVNGLMPNSGHYKTFFREVSLCFSRPQGFVV